MHTFFNMTRMLSLLEPFCSVALDDKCGSTQSSTTAWINTIIHYSVDQHNHPLPHCFIFWSLNPIKADFFWVIIHTETHPSTGIWSCFHQRRSQCVTLNFTPQVVRLPGLPISVVMVIYSVDTSVTVGQIIIIWDIYTAHNAGASIRNTKHKTMK